MPAPTLLRIFVGQEKPDAGSVSLDPPDLEIGYLEQGLSYSDADTLDDVVRSGRRALAKAEAEVARLAAALAANDNADGLEASDRLDAYGEALARMIRLVESLPAEHEVSAALPASTSVTSRWTLRLGISVGARRLAWGWRACYSASTTCCSLMSPPTTSTSRRSNGWSPGCGDFTGAAIIVSHDRAFLDRTANWITTIWTSEHATLTPIQAPTPGILPQATRARNNH